MFSLINLEKERRKKRLERKNREKINVKRAYKECKSELKRFLYDDEYSDNWELINSR